jgi:hypothetical protein
MKDKFTLELTRHQAKVLSGALVFVKQFIELPEGTPLYNIPTEGIASDLVKAELILIQEEVIRQFKEQDDLP